MDNWVVKIVEYMENQNKIVNTFFNEVSKNEKDIKKLIKKSKSQNLKIFVLSMIGSTLLINYYKSNAEIIKLKDELKNLKKDVKTFGIAKES